MLGILTEELSLSRAGLVVQHVNVRLHVPEPRPLQQASELARHSIMTLGKKMPRPVKCLEHEFHEAPVGRTAALRDHVEFRNPNHPPRLLTRWYSCRSLSQSQVRRKLVPKR